MEGNAVGTSGRRPRRGLRLVGWTLVLAGILGLGWGGWELVGTNWVSHRTQHRLVGEAEQQWRVRSGVVLTNRGRVTSVLRIPRFGAGYAVPVIEGTSDTALASGVGHFAGTAPAGGRGNFALAGHRITHGQPFHDLPDLRPGDRVVVETGRATYTYVLDTGGTDLTVPFTAGWVLAARPVNPDGGPQGDPSSRHLLTLTTCSELFHTDNRSIVFGHLVSTQRPGDDTGRG